ncbi:hypothetical protein [Gordonia paraffinivorans]|uniref:hypothetical protein n=1 Tax=Gordonia paraffinivorans TaxID=175628 RepID=UPI00058D6610|nr:hypothetical protein [Gordonia paraffinivorans]
MNNASSDVGRGITDRRPDLVGAFVDVEDQEVSPQRRDDSPDSLAGTCSFGLCHEAYSIA